MFLSVITVWHVVHRCGDTRGSIMVNSRPRDMKTFRKMCRYIMQEDLLQPCLTVLESMEIAADLKLGDTIPKDDKLDSVMPRKPAIESEKSWFVFPELIFYFKFFRSKKSSKCSVSPKWNIRSWRIYPAGKGNDCLSLWNSSTTPPWYFWTNLRRKRF